MGIETRYEKYTDSLITIKFYGKSNVFFDFFYFY